MDDIFKVMEDNGMGRLQSTDKTPVGRVNVGDTIVMKDGNKYVVKEIIGPMYDPFTFEEVHGIFIFDDKIKSDRKVNEKEIVEVIHKEEA